LGYCNFQLQNFDNAAIYYDRLSSSYPDIPEYQYYLAQSLYHSTNYEEALNASYLRGDPDEELQEKVNKN
jgi:tetratricopeptide repeat protein 30